MNLHKSSLLTLFLALGTVSTMAYDDTYFLLPSVADITYSDGYVDFAEGTPVTVNGTDSRAVKFASDLTARNVAAVASSEVAKGSPSVTLIDNPAMTSEQYSIAVNKDGVAVSASGSAGYYYAAQTLAQMIRQTDGRLRECSLTDSPRFGYRGMMIDVVRCYVPVEELKKLIDQAAALKINNVHLHLTDDNGWRLEIKKYPRLTEVGAWRVDRPEIFPARLNARSADEPALYGGFYSQDQMRELVSYASERNVNIVPEIELPAHAAAAIASYPGLTCPVDEEFIGVFPGIGGKDASIIICGGNDDAITFYKDVLDEVMDIFPSQMIHLGGDEANKSRWEKCPKCNQRINDLGLKDYEALQGWLMNQIAAHVTGHGRTPVGWDEATYGDPTRDMTIMGWQGSGKVAVDDSRRTGRKFIMTPAQKLYLIRYQGPQWFEPFTYFGNNTLTDIYNYEPVGSDWTTVMEESLQGIQGSLWSEFCSSGADMEYLLFPRMLAVAERAWSPKGRYNWPDFIASADNMLDYMSDNGINWAPSMYNIQHKAVPDGNGNVKVTLTNERPDMAVRYAEGNTSVADGTKYAGTPIITEGGATIYAATYDGEGRQHGRMLALPIVKHLATGRNVSASSSNGLHHVLTNGVRGSNRNSDFEWAGWHNKDAEMTVDLGSPKHIGSVAIGSLVYADLCIAAPSAIELYASTDGEDYTLVDRVEYSPDVTFNATNRIIETRLKAPAEDVRYLCIKAANPGLIPDGMAREGAKTWLYFDEITVR